MDRIGILGGTGIEGRGLAVRLAAAGVTVTIGSRSQERAAAAAQECNRILGDSLVTGQANEELPARSEIVMLTVPFEHAVETVTSYASLFTPATILVDVTVPMRFVDRQPEYVQQEAGSGAETLARHLPPGISLVAAFKEIPAHLLADLSVPLDCDLLVCGDSVPAKERVMAVAARIPSLRPLDAGPLRMAATIERMTVLAVQLNRRYKQKGARFQVRGI